LPESAVKCLDNGGALVDGVWKMETERFNFILDGKEKFTFTTLPVLLRNQVTHNKITENISNVLPY
jgi:hypothetical protein